MLHFYINAQNSGEVVEDIARRKGIISSIHDTSHLGVNRMLDMVVGKCYWPGLSSDVRAYVSVSKQKIKFLQYTKGRITGLRW